MILLNYIQFRGRCVRIVTGTGTFTFSDSNPDRIARSAGNYLTDLCEDGMNYVFTGTASNDGIEYRSTTVAGTQVNLESGSDVVAEGPVAATFEAFHRDLDGLPRFPGPKDSTNLVRANSFDGGITGAPSPYLGVLFTLTVNALTADASPGVDEFDWYVSQRTDDAAKQYWQLTSYDPGGGDTASGSMSMAHTTLATAELGVQDGPLPAELADELTLDVHVYCRRISDGAIQWLDLRRALTVY